MPDEVVLPPLPASVKQARDFVRSALAARRCSVTADDAILVASELVTNAVLHAGTDITVRVVEQGQDLRVEVADGSAEVPGLRIPSPAARSGRGLLIVEHFSERWGVEPTASGKVVWFVVAKEG